MIIKHMQTLLLSTMVATLNSVGFPKRRLGSYKIKFTIALVFSSSVNE